MSRWIQAVRPLRVTALTTAALLALPGLTLLLFPRSRASGLDRLLPSAALVQSFAANPQQPPPPLWQQRLGPERARHLWVGQRRLWWQFWGGHSDAGAYLVLPAPAQGRLPANALRLDDLWVVAADPLARQLLQEQLKVQWRPPRGMEQRCSQTLRNSESVLWNPAALGPLLGPLAPLVQSVQQGCLELRSDGRSLLWQGEADATPQTVSPPPGRLSPPASLPLAAPLLLELQGPDLGLLLRGLLSSSLLRQSLGQGYGIGPSQQTLLLQAPFQLRLRAVKSGPFQAGLELQLSTGADRRPWQQLLSGLQKALSDRGLEELQARPAAGGQRLGPVGSTWVREDGQVVGGWRWLPVQQQQLLLYLGPTPSLIAARTPLEPGDWRLRLRPTALVAAGLLPDSLPLVVRRSLQLQMIGRSRGQRSGERQSALAGRLDL